MMRNLLMKSGSSNMYAVLVGRNKNSPQILSFEIGTLNRRFLSVEGK
jgi:hypothetical protein